MDKTREELERYRQRKREEQARMEAARPAAAPPTVDRSEASRPWIAVAYSVLDALDPLDCIPFRMWRSSYDSHPGPTLLASLALYAIGQAYFVWCEFGAVFFVFSSLTALCLGLGSRRAGEVSAYSVFNPNCERLLGSMTAEHFERDMLHKRTT